MSLDNDRAVTGACRKSVWFAILTCTLAFSTHADCTLPSPPSKIPDAATATEQEMIEAMGVLKQYSADIATYVKCLDFEARQLVHAKLLPEQKQTHDRLSALKKRL